jgi:peroxiredoxin
LQKGLEAIQSRNAVLLAISKYDAEETARWLEENEWTFPVLCNGSAVIEQYNLFNERQQKPGREGIPHPATIIINLEGSVRFKNVWVDYKKRTPLGTIIEELDKLK